MRKTLKKQKSISRKRWLRRRLAIRKTVVGTTEVPRLCLIKSSNNLRALLVDDSQSKTLCEIKTFGKNSDLSELKKNKATAEKLGQIMGDKIKSLGHSRVVYDRYGYPFSGIVKTFADKVKESGIHV